MSFLLAHSPCLNPLSASLLPGCEKKRKKKGAREGREERYTYDAAKTLQDAQNLCTSQYPRALEALRTRRMRYFINVLSGEGQDDYKSDHTMWIWIWRRGFLVGMKEEEFEGGVIKGEGECCLGKAD